MASVDHGVSRSPSMSGQHPLPDVTPGFPYHSATIIRGLIRPRVQRLDTNNTFGQKTGRGLIRPRVQRLDTNNTFGQKTGRDVNIEAHGRARVNRWPRESRDADNGTNEYTARQNSEKRRKSKNIFFASKTILFYSINLSFGQS
jgi:hypothetical protein